MKLLTADEGYRLWAPHYERETAISLLDQDLVGAMTLPLAGQRLLDVGCGTGRRLRATGAAAVTGVEPSAEMLAAGAGQGPWPDEVTLLQGDVRALPLPAGGFDIVWCRLVLGHLPDCGSAYAELARVCASDARLIVTDFHPRAFEEGHRRTFRHAGELLEIEHHVHDLYTQHEAAAAAGLELVEVKEAAIGPAIRDFYADAGKLDLYNASLGLPVVLALSFRRAA